MSVVLRETMSICPVCGERLPARYVRRGEDVVLERECEKHGRFAAVTWRGAPDFSQWCTGWESTETPPDCPTQCGLCEGHENQTCCAILDVTQRCNLNCPICFAAAGDGKDMPLAEVLAALDDMYEKGVRFLYLSGGEPTVRDDLEQITAYAIKLGYVYIQLNTNGLRLAQEPEYAKRLCEAGVSSVFLQFDGTDDAIYRTIRGCDLLEIKKQAIRNCDAAELGVVLVPTVIPGVNDQNLGQIVRFAVEQMPAVKGIHFQPVTYTGRYIVDAELDHFTLPELLAGLETQTGGLVKSENFAPSACDAPLCGFHGEFRFHNGALVAQHIPDSGGCCCSPAPVSSNQKHVKSRWTRMKRGDYPEGSIDAFLQELNDKSFCISAMVFQDRSNLDLGRARRCSVHVYDRGRLVPFCIYHNVYKGARP